MPRAASRTQRRDDASDMTGRWAVTRQVVQFSLVGLLALIVVGVAFAVASRRVGEREAITDARTTTLVKAQGLVEPVVTNGLAAERPGAVHRVGTVVQNSVLDPDLVRVKIWTRTGHIVYSDEPRLVGTSYTLGEDEIAALDQGVIEAEVSDLSKPENQYERSFGKLLEVYLPIRTPDGQRLLFEAYFRYDAVSAAGRHIWTSFAPIAIGALVALELVQIPLAWSLARRLRDRQQERERLLQHAVDASENERRRIASDLHDGVVQDLAGVAYSLAGASRRPDLTTGTTDALEESASHVRESIKALRTLLVDIYPPRLAEAGLDTALSDLLASVRNRGTETTCETDDLPAELPEPIAGLLYRVAREALRNVITHARASSVHVHAYASDGRVVLDVIDDGVGFDLATAAHRPAEGHVGLRGVQDMVADAGGTVEVRSTPGQGTAVHVEVPLHDPGLDRRRPRSRPKRP
ncbi:MAG: sensor histidine kinase [Frankiaceae bacterium]|nr:sensor histidine kinase [Frankiaceae bacterium]